MAEKLKSIVDRVLSGLLGDAEHAEKDRPHLMLDMLSDWLFVPPVLDSALFFIGSLPSANKVFAAVRLSRAAASPSAG